MHPKYAYCCESAAPKMPANLENSAVATGLEKVSFHSNPKEGQCRRQFKLPHNCTHFTCWQSNAQNYHILPHISQHPAHRKPGGLVLAFMELLRASGSSPARPYLAILLLSLTLHDPTDCSILSFPVSGSFLAMAARAASF